MPKKIKKPPIKGIAQVPEDKLTVIKSNPLSSLWRSELTLSEFKVLDAYLARINSHYPERRQVEITKKEFESVFGLSKFNIKELDSRLEHLVGQAVRITDSDYKKGFAWISLFEEARVDFDDDGVQTVYLECTQKAMKYFFSCDNLGYLRYKLRSVKDMKSRYTYVLFLYLEKHRYMGLEWDEPLDNLKIFLNCENDETYKQYKHFNDKILKRCHSEILEKTECHFSYQPIKKGRKVTVIHFKLESLQSVISPELEVTIDKNQLTFEDMSEQKPPEYDVDDRLGLLSEAVNNEFTPTQMDEIFQNICLIPLDEKPHGIDIARYHYLRQLYAKLNTAAERTAAKGKPIKDRYKYFITLLKKDKEEQQ